MRTFWLTVLLVAILGGVSSSVGEDECSFTDAGCQDGTDNRNNNKDGIDKIFAWWDKMSAIKPLKCKDRYASTLIKDEDLDTITQEFEFRICRENERGTLYAYKGFVEDENGMLSGAGKFVMKPG